MHSLFTVAVEIRNKDWVVPQFVEVVRERGIALALIDQSWMPRPLQYFEKFDPITADFTFVRWLGDRKEIELQAGNRCSHSMVPQPRIYQLLAGQRKINDPANLRRGYSGC